MVRTVSIDSAQIGPLQAYVWADSSRAHAPAYAGLIQERSLSL